MNTPEPDQSQPCAGEGWSLDAFALALCRFANLNPDEVIADGGHTVLDYVRGHDAPRLLAALRGEGPTCPDCGDTGWRPNPFAPDDGGPCACASPQPLPGEGVEELRGLSERASRGEWVWRNYQFKSGWSRWVIAPGVLVADGTAGTPGGDRLDRDNAALIVAAVNFVRAELARRTALQGGGSGE